MADLFQPTVSTSLHGRSYLELLLPRSVEGVKSDGGDGDEGDEDVHGPPNGDPSGHIQIDHAHTSLHDQMGREIPMDCRNEGR